VEGWDLFHAGMWEAGSRRLFTCKSWQEEGGSPPVAGGVVSAGRSEARGAVAEGARPNVNEGRACIQSAFKGLEAEAERQGKCAA